MSFASAAKEELKQVGLVTIYFMFCFAVALTLKKLFLAEYQIEFYALSAVVIGGLVAGKVVVVLDHTPIGRWLDSGQRPGLAALYKTIVYTLVAALVVAGEKVFHAYRESGALGPRSRPSGRIGTGASSWQRCSASAWPSSATTSSWRPTASWARARSGGRSGLVSNPQPRLLRVGH